MYLDICHQSYETFFCTPAVVQTGYFDCVMNTTTGKVIVANMFVTLIIWCKIQEKNYWKLQFI